MKQSLLFILFLSLSLATNGQSLNRRINFNPIDKDSLNMSLNGNFNLIEDSCAQIIRHTRFNFETRKFHGKFTDVSKADPNIIITEGNYSPDGLKDGAFILHYLDGKVQAKGSFKDDKLAGRWERFYENGKPEVTFEAKDNDYTIIDAWKPDGTKIVDNGNGLYVADFKVFYWKGKLVNGKPDGSWKLYDAKDNSVTATEKFKNGQFMGGENQIMSYSNASRISLISTIDIPFINAEGMRVGAPCDFQGLVPNRIVNAHYKSGIDAFNNRMGLAVTNYLNHNNLEGVVANFFITGDITVQGTIENLTREGVYAGETARGLIRVIESLPRLEPATVDGKPVVQKFQISFEIRTGHYSYSFRFLPIKL